MKKVTLLFTAILLQYLTVVQATELSKSEQTQIIKASSSVVKGIFEAANRKRFLDGLDYYVDGENAFYVSDGKINSLNDLRESYKAIGPSVDVIHNEILAWNAIVLSSELVSFTLPVALTLKLKNTPEYTGKIIWSAVLQKQGEQWLVVQSHESWLNCAEVAKVLSQQTQ